jgi:hypothetical protein
LRLIESLTVPGLSDDENATLNVLLAQLDARSKRNLLRSSIYDGKRAIKQVGTVIPPQYKRLGLILGWNAKGVDGLARRCNLERMVWPDGDLNSLGMQELTDSNFLLSEIASGRTDSLIHGVSYLITTQGLEGEPKALIHAKDALNATGEWNNRKRRLDNLLSVTSWKEGKVTGFVLYLDNLTISAEKDADGWEISRSEHPWHVPADPMVYRPRASRRMGRSRITRPTIGLQDAAVRALIRMEGHMDIYSIPQLWLLGASDSIFNNADGTRKASWQVALGRVYGVPDDLDAEQANQRADIKQFKAESPEAHLAQLNALAKLTAREFDLSDADFALTDMANPTSEGSYSEARENLLAEAEGATDDWSISVRRAVTRALAIQNGETEIPAAWASIDTKWRNPQFVSRASAADAGSKQLAAVPWLAETEVGLELLGMDEQLIKRALGERRRAQGRALVSALAQGTITGSNEGATATAQADADAE